MYFLNTLNADNKISITAMVLACVSYFPSFISLWRTRHRIETIITSFDYVLSEINKEFIYKLHIINIGITPIKIDNICLVVNKNKYFPYPGIEHNWNIPANDILEITIAFFVPKNTPEKDFKFELYTTNGTKKTKYLQPPASNYSNQNGSD